MKKKKIGIYGGTFDPIHFGHLNLACELSEKHALDQVWFVPAQVNPHKSERPPIAIEYRLAMLHLALDPCLPFVVKDLENQRPPPSYTIDTLQFIIQDSVQESHDTQFYLLLGEDALSSFMQWHHWEKIIELVPLLIGSRSGQWDYRKFKEMDAMNQVIRQGLTRTRMMDISSSEVRERLSKNLYCGHLVPAAVLEYRDKNGLYRPNF